MVWEAKIKLVDDVKNMGSWDEVGWCEALAKLTRRPVNDFQDPVAEMREEGE